MLLLGEVREAPFRQGRAQEAKRQRGTTFAVNPSFGGVPPVLQPFIVVRARSQHELVQVELGDGLLFHLKVQEVADMEGNTRGGGG